MIKQSENKVTKTDTIDKSKQPPAAPTKDELSEQDLNKAAGGIKPIFDPKLPDITISK